MSASIAKNWIGLSAIIAVCLSAFGCQVFSTTSGARFASVEISGHSTKEVSAATIAVFDKAGYMSTGVGDELLFERDGPEWMQIAYGSNIKSGGPVSERIKAQIVNLGDGTLRLQCSAYAMPESGGIGDKEMQLLMTRRRPYRALLEQVAQKFSATP
ncbi:hypothetical protein SCARR_04574 [Pontiella sulfatireligans]|uniref:Uncharacterized protein n=2 Tax=Pontiella sulfatireligans TaxID=2750658 RepID=A0A6C2UTA5_9BACT|nr:hypothetical protein SCARR_04574 [Pontiella sulfatireligans]